MQTEQEVRIMNTEKHIVAIDLGTSKMAIIVAKVCGSNVQVVYYKETPSYGIKYSGVNNILQASGPLSNLIHEAAFKSCIF